ncbi:hypothetical protein NKG94_22355 [Micromonospora sp. M12]
MDVRIQQSVVANLSNRPAPVAVGPFVIGMDPTTASPHINYATPFPGAAITAADVAALVAAFRAVDRKPRLSTSSVALPAWRHFWSLPASAWKPATRTCSACPAQ